MFKNKKTYKIIVISVIALLTILLCFLFFRIYKASRDNIININDIEMREKTKEIDYTLQRAISELDLSADMVQHLISTNESNETILDYLIIESRKTSKVFEGNQTGLYGYIRGEYLDGVEWVPDESYYPLTRPWYTAAKNSNGKTVLVGPYIDSQTGFIILSFAKLLEDHVSVISFDILLNPMQSKVMNISRSTNYSVLVITKQDLIVASSIDGTKLKDLSNSSNPMLDSLYNSYLKSNNQDFEFKYDGINYIVFNQIMDNDWHTFVIVKSGDIVSPLKNLFFSFISVLVIFSCAALVIFLGINERRKSAEDANKQLQSIADIYMTMYKLDLNKDEYVEIKEDSYISKIVKESSKNPTEMINEVIHKIKLKTKFTHLNLKERIEENKVLTYEFETDHGWIRERFIPIDNKNEKDQSVLWVLENIDIEKRREENLVHEVYHDELTAIYNRKAYENRLRSFDNSQLNENLICVVFDVNELKYANDFYGHIAGDELILNSSNLLVKCFGEYGEIFRTGGDEFFAIVYMEPDLLNETFEKFEKLTNEWTGKYAKKLSISYGSASVKEFPNLLILELAKIADNRMYEYKEKYYKNNRIKRR